MSVRSRMLLACESFLRVPPLLVIDEIFRMSFGFGGKPFSYGAVKDSSSRSLAESVIVTSNKGDASLELTTTGGGRNNVDDLISTNLLGDYGVNSTVIEFSIHTLTEFFKGSWFKYIQNQTITSPIESEVFVKSTEAVGSDNVKELTEEFASDLMFGGQVLLSFVLFFAAVVMFMLSKDNLIKLYSYLLSFVTLYVAYITPPPVMNTSPSDLILMSMNITFRTVLATVFFACKSWSAFHVTPNNQMPSYLDPLLLSLFFITTTMKVSPVIFVACVIALHSSLILCLPKLYTFLLTSWADTKRIQNEYGLSHLIQVESGRLKINTVFRLFWVTRAAYDAFYRCCDEPLSLIIRYVMVHGTETFTGIVGLTVTVAAISHQIGDFLLWLLYFGSNSEVDLNRFGSISTVLFFILSLQSGLTSLDPEKRLDRLFKNMALLGTALFHALHQLVAPLLHAFRSFQAVQIRAVTLSCVFLIFSFGLTFSMLKWTTISTWSLAVLALAIEFKIKVVISLIISIVVYLSQLVQYPELLENTVAFFRRILPRPIMHFFDQLYDQISHEDMVFYLKTVANIAEFITGVFLFFNAVWIFLFESTSAIRAIGMSIHAYFNIWCEAQKGFKIYCQRKTASKKIMSLKDATDEQIRNRSDDVCSICYEGFESAKVTTCGHLFHSVCLRKWLYVQNTCPMCHDILYREDVVDETSDLEPMVAQNNGNGVPRPDNNQNLSDNSGDEEQEDNNIRQPSPAVQVRPIVRGRPRLLPPRPRRIVTGHLLRRRQLQNHGVAVQVALLTEESDGNESDDVENDPNNLLHEVDDADSSDFDDVEIWNERDNLERRDHENDNEDGGDLGGGGPGGGLPGPANGRGLVLFL